MPKDSFVIAELIRFGRYAESNVAQDKLLALKELCRNRFYLVDMASDLKRKITALIDRVFPEYETQFDSIFLQVLRGCIEEISHATKNFQCTPFQTNRDTVEQQ